MLIEEVVAATPDVEVLESACRHIRRTSKFIPTVSELLDAIADQKKLWDAYWDATNLIDEWADHLRQKLATETERRATEKAAHERKVAKAQALTVGDRVRNLKLGAGTVSDVVPMDEGGNHYRVRFDAGAVRHVAGATYLERLIAGDDGFEPAMLPMLEYRESVPMIPIPIASPVTIDVAACEERETSTDISGGAAL
jgi:hypothetical protein